MRERDPIASLGDDVNRVLLFGALADAPELRVLGDAGVLGGFVVGKSGVAKPEVEAVCFLRLNCLWSRDALASCAREHRHVNVLLFGRCAVNIGRYLYARRRLFVDGELCSTRLSGVDGLVREEVCVVASRIEFLGPPLWEFERARRETGQGGKALRQDASEAPVVPGECTVGFSEDVWI
jgi:single-stranded DNA-binding protein